MRVRALVWVLSGVALASAQESLFYAPFPSIVSFAQRGGDTLHLFAKPVGFTSSPKWLAFWYRRDGEEKWARKEMQRYPHNKAYWEGDIEPRGKRVSFRFVAQLSREIYLELPSPTEESAFFTLYAPQRRELKEWSYPQSLQIAGLSVRINEEQMLLELKTLGKPVHGVGSEAFYGVHLYYAAEDKPRDVHHGVVYTCELCATLRRFVGAPAAGLFEDPPSPLFSFEGPSFISPSEENRVFVRSALSVSWEKRGMLWEVPLSLLRAPPELFRIYAQVLWFEKRERQVFRVGRRDKIIYYTFDTLDRSPLITVRQVRRSFPPSQERRK